MATQDFEVRQLLKAYRKGLISDVLFEEQMKELNSDSQRSYAYNGKTHATEREMVMHLLDEFRSGETFATEFLGRWIEVSDQECVKGGLRVVQQRENYHAQLLEARLRELGGTPQASVPAERREKELAFYSSTEKNDGEKLASIAALLKDPAEILKPITDVVAQIQEDQQSKELLGLLVADEMSSVKWFLDAHKTLSGT
jgi:Mn-containing catalase